MLRSMTGFGRAEGLVSDKKVTVEIRSLNSKQLDLFLKLPGLYKEKDTELRQLLTERVVRGKCELFVSSEPAQGAHLSNFDAALVRRYYTELKTLVQSVDPHAHTDLMGFVLRMPDVNGSVREQLQEEEWLGVKKLIDDCVRGFISFRESEGTKLMADLRMRCERIGTLLNEVEAQDGGRAERTRERIRSRLAELQAKVDQDRFEQELVFYLEKMDINEEKVRLRAHCGYFVETLDHEEQQGRKLGFITQEMGREINTLGSKANDAIMQRNVVLMKDELEKIKEQVLNVL
jgi:uncharacterized protein (TIGR00255 family)